MDELLKADKQTDSLKDIAFSEGFNTAMNLFSEITEFSSRDLKHISMCQNNKFLRKHLDFWIANRKHKNRKYAKEILKLVHYITSAMSITEQFETPKTSLMDRLRFR